MNSQTLKENGFAAFYPLKELTLMNLPGNNQVFVLIDKTISGKPAPSDILYIGRAKKPVKKIFAGFIGGSGGKTVKKINDALFNQGYIEKIAIGWMANENPKMAQKELLEKFKAEHGEYPTWNAPKKEPAKRLPKQKTAKPKKTPKSTATPKVKA
jgi:hypothetical protein